MNQKEIKIIKTIKKLIFINFNYVDEKVLSFITFAYYRKSRKHKFVKNKI